mgnify:CR=1 FL=1
MRMTPRNVDNVNIMENLKSERAYHHGDLRNALIDAGMNALATQDAAELSLRALARELGVSANAAYRHFADKDALLSALAAEGFRRFAAEQADSRCTTGPGPGQTGLKGGPQDEALSSGLRYVQFAQRHPGLFRLMFGRFLLASQDAELQGAAMAAFMQLLEQSRAPDAPPGPPDEATLMRALARWSLVHGLSHLLLEGQLGLFGAQPDGLVRAVLEASGLGDAGRPETKVSN